MSYLDRLASRTCMIWGVTRAAFDGRSRVQSLSRARSAFALVAVEAGVTLEDIGFAIGRHHCTVMHLRDRAVWLDRHDDDFRPRISLLRSVSGECSGVRVFVSEAAVAELLVASRAMGMDPRKLAGLALEAGLGMRDRPWVRARKIKARRKRLARLGAA